jgi:uncharacterized protein
MNVPASALYGSILAVMTILLAMNVSRHRGRASKLFGHGDDDGLESAIRAHGNASEYVPLGVLMLVIAELMGANATSMHGLGGTLLLARIGSAHGIVTRTPATRAAGALFTWLSILGAVAYVVLLRFK